MVERWYQSGLKFKCTECGKCCTGGPGYVWIDVSEAANIASFLKISTEQFMARYTRLTFGRIALLEKQPTFDCIFLKDKKCQIYAARPHQCRRFPWWKENLQSPESWSQAAQHCEGINHPEAPLINLETIENQVC
jgi:Fe-S-cluster containining protein